MQRLPSTRGYSSSESQFAGFFCSITSAVSAAAPQLSHSTSILVMLLLDIIVSLITTHETICVFSPREEEQIAMAAHQHLPRILAAERVLLTSDREHRCRACRSKERSPSCLLHSLWFFCWIPPPRRKRNTAAAAAASQSIAIEH